MDRIITLVVSGCLGVISSAVYFYLRFRTQKEYYKSINNEIIKLESSLNVEIATTNVDEFKLTQAGKELLLLIYETSVINEGNINRHVDVGEEKDFLLAVTEDVVKNLIENMGFKANIVANFSDEETTNDAPIIIRVDITGEDLSELIGKKAETLNSFQYIASLIVAKRLDRWIQLVVDIEGYRTRRESQIRQLANRVAKQVFQTGENQPLEHKDLDETESKITIKKK